MEEKSFPAMSDNTRFPRKTNEKPHYMASALPRHVLECLKNFV